MNLTEKYCKELIKSFKTFEELFVDINLRNDKGHLFKASEFSIKNTGKYFVVGNAGSGKTVLLNYLSYIYSKNYLEKKSPIPIKISARNLSSSNTIESEIEKIIGSKENIPIILLIDGLDELINYSIERLFKEISKLNYLFSTIVSSRPRLKELLFTDFETIKIEGFNKSQITGIISKRFDKKHSANLLHSLDRIESIKSLITIPLFINLFTKVFEAFGRIPDSKYNLLETYTNYILSTWDLQKNIGSRALLNLGDINLFLGSIAYYQYKLGVANSSLDELWNSSKSVLKLKKSDFIELISYYNERGILISQDERILFAHKTINEYYLVKYCLKNENAFRVLIDKNINLLIDNIKDVEQLISKLISENKLSLAYEFVNKSEIANKSIILNLFKYIFNSAKAVSQTKGDKQETNDLLELWYGLEDKQLNSYEKGKIFEEFAIALFESFFNILSHNLNTQNGEFDIVMEQKSIEPFWSEYGGIILIECKNWSSNIPLKDIGSFHSKVLNSRAKLGIFISMSGFTKDAKRMAENIANSISNPLIVLISGKDIKDYLFSEKLDLNIFLKNIITEIRLNRKY